MITVTGDIVAGYEPPIGDVTGHINATDPIPEAYFSEFIDTPELQGLADVPSTGQFDATGVVAGFANGILWVLLAQRPAD